MVAGSIGLAMISLRTDAQSRRLTECLRATAVGEAGNAVGATWRSDAASRLRALDACSAPHP